MKTRTPFLLLALLSIPLFSNAQLYFYVYGAHQSNPTYCRVVRFDGDRMYTIHGKISDVRKKLENNRGFFENMTETTPFTDGFRSVGTNNNRGPVSVYKIDNQKDIPGKTVYIYWYVRENEVENYVTIPNDKSYMQHYNYYTGDYEQQKSWHKEKHRWIRVTEDYILLPASLDADIEQLLMED